MKTVTEEVTSDHDNFSLPISAVPDDILDEITRHTFFTPEDLPDLSEVRYGEVRPAMENMDDRRSHTRALDAAIQRSMERYGQDSYDLILTNVEYDLNHLVEEKSRSDEWYQGEIDLMLVDLDQNWVRALEAKPHPGSMVDHNGDYILQAPTHREKVERQHEHQAFAFNIMNEELDGFMWDYTPERGYDQVAVFEDELHPRYKIPESYVDPDNPDETLHHWTEEVAEKAYASEDFMTFQEDFVLQENSLSFSPDRRINVREEGRGDFLEPYI